MKSALPRQDLCSTTVPFQVTERLEAELSRASNQLGVSHEQVLLMSLRRGLDMLAVAEKRPQRGTQGRPDT